jgi:hypothetical protein
MKKIIFLIFPYLLFADITTNSQKSIQKSKSEKEQIQKQQQLQHQKSKTLAHGKEKSLNKNVTNSISFIKSFNRTASKNASGTWSIQLNPIPYILMELQKLGWNKNAFFLTNKDLGFNFSYGRGDDEVIDLNAKEFYTQKAQIRGRIDRDKIKKIQKLINLLYVTGQLVDETATQLKHFPTLNFLDFRKKIDHAILNSYKKLRKNGVKNAYIYNCNFGGNLDTISCNTDKGIFTLKLTDSVPNLLINGYLYYSSSNIGFTKPTLTLSFATNLNQALSFLEQNAETASITKIIREYTQKLESEGKTKIANEIKSKFIEKALTTNITNQTSAIINAINSGSPIAVLNIFR